MIDDGSEDRTGDRDASPAAVAFELEEFDLRLKAAVLLRRGEPMCFIGESRVCSIGDALQIFIERDAGLLVVRLSEVRCHDAVTRDGLLAVPIDSSAVGGARIGLQRTPDGIVIYATVELRAQVLRREELQLLRSELELHAARIRRWARPAAAS